MFIVNISINLSKHWTVSVFCSYKPKRPEVPPLPLIVCACLIFYSSVYTSSERVSCHLFRANPLLHWSPIAGLVKCEREGVFLNLLIRH